MRESRLYFAALILNATTLILTAAFCVDTGGENGVTDYYSCIPVEGLIPVDGCGCPVDSSSYYSTGFMRSSLTAHLSQQLAQSIAEKNLSLFLTMGGNSEMQNIRSKSAMTRINGESDPAIGEKVRRAQERIELAKKIISEQEMSSKLEYLKMRRTLSKNKPKS